MTGLLCRDLISLESHTFQDITTKMFITSNPWTLDVTDACTVLNHFFATAVVKWPRVHSHSNSLEWPRLFPWDSSIKRAQPAPRSSPNTSLPLSIIQKTTLGLHMWQMQPISAGSTWVPPAATWAQLPAGTQLSLLPCPSHGNSGALHLHSCSASRNCRAKLTTFHKLSSVLVALLYPQLSAEVSSSSYTWLL